MTSEWRTIRAADFIDFNPRLSLKKGDIATKVAMDKLKPFTKKIPETEKAEFNGGAKFCNGDTVMARITPCLENGKTAYVDMLDDGEIGFGSTEFIVMRAKTGISDPQFVYYTAINPVFRNVAIKSMVGSSGRQRVQQSVLEELELSVPDLDEQRRIGDFLARIDEKIALNDRINDNLQQQAFSVFDNLIANAGNVGPAVAFTSFDFGPYLSKRTSSDIPDVPGRTLFVLCDGFSGLAIDDRAEQNLPLQFGQCMQGVIDLGVQIHEGIFIRTLRQILASVKPPSVVVNCVAYFLRQERFRIVRSGLLYIQILQSIRCCTLAEVGLAVVEHMLQLLPLLRMLLHPLVCGSGSFRIHRVYPAPVGLKLFIGLGILEGHELTALSAFTKSLQLSTFRFCDFSLSNSRRTISPG